MQVLLGAMQLPMPLITDKAMTVRLSAELAGQLDIIAWVQRVPMAEIIREAIRRYLASR